MFNYFVITLFIAFGLNPSTGFSQGKTCYLHPYRNFSFSAEGSWVENPYHKDDMIYEMVNEEKAVTVVLWYNGGTEMSCPDYLIKMADFKGLAFGKPVERCLDDKTQWILETEGIRNGMPVHNTIVAMSYREKYGDDVPARCLGREYNAMHLAQIICPQDKYEERKAMIDEIVMSLELSP